MFKKNANVGSARSCTLYTSHGEIETPFFMPVATQGSVKALDPGDLRNAGSEIVLGNAYHLYLRPGTEIISQLGGLHKFMGWSGPLLTDSGGFQGFSLRHLRNITEAGISFKSHIDGSNHMLTPESAIEIQELIGADIIMPLDVCLPATACESEVVDAIDRTMRWMNRCLSVKKNDHQLLFGIVQGGLFMEHRKTSVASLVDLDLPGYAIGGLSVGESKSAMYSIVSQTASVLPENKPRYLMGVGAPEDLVECVANGIDMFDCVMPTRVARNGALYKRTGRENITVTKYKSSDRPFDEDCNCYACTRFSAGYINHLFRSKEYLAYRLASIHNLNFIHTLMYEMRVAIKSGFFSDYVETFRSEYNVPNTTIN